MRRRSNSKKENLKKEENLRKKNERALIMLQNEIKATEEKLKQESMDALAHLANKAKEMDEQVAKENEEAEKQLGRENKIIEEEQRKKNEENLAILISENKSRMFQILSKEGKEVEVKGAKEKEENRVGRKRKADQLEVATKKEPAAPECPVCAWKRMFFESTSHLFAHRFVLRRCCLLPRSSSVAVEATSSASLASNLNLFGM